MFFLFLFFEEPSVYFIRLSNMGGNRCRSSSISRSSSSRGKTRRVRTPTGGHERFPQNNDDDAVLKVFYSLFYFFFIITPHDNLRTTKFDRCARSNCSTLLLRISSRETRHSCSHTTSEIILRKK